VNKVTPEPIKGFQPNLTQNISYSRATKLLPVVFQGHGSKVKVTKNVFRSKLVNAVVCDLLKGFQT